MNVLSWIKNRIVINRRLNDYCRRPSQVEIKGQLYEWIDPTTVRGKNGKLYRVCKAS